MKYNYSLLRSQVIQKRRDLEIEESKIISMNKIADRIGIKNYTLNKAMNADAFPSVETLHLICKFLATRMEDYVLEDDV